MSVAEHLTSLESSSLIRVAQIEPEIEYLFRHAMVQDVTYSSLLRQDRKKLHLQVAATLEAMYPDRLEELASTLARHFVLADQADRAFHYLMLAGDRQAVQFANQEAISHYEAALELADEANAPADRLRQLYMRYGRVLELQSCYEDAVALYRRAEADGIARHDAALEMEALSARATIQATPNPLFNPSEAQQIIERALQLATSLGEEPIQAKLYWNLMLMHLYSFGEEHGRQAVEAGERSLAICREHAELVEQTAFTLNDLFGAYARVSRLEDAQRVNMESRDMWQQLGNIPMLVDALSANATVQFRLGDYDALIADSQHAFEMAGAIHHTYGQASTRQFVCVACFDIGHVSQAIELLQEALVLGDSVGYPGAHFGRGFLGMALGELGQADQGLELAQEALAACMGSLQFMTLMPLANVTRLLIIKGDLPAAQEHLDWCFREDHGFLSYFNMSMLVLQAAAELALAQGNDLAAVNYADQQLARLRETRMLPYQADALHVKALALMRLGRIDEAHEALRQGIQIAESLGSRRMLWQLNGALADVFDAQGRSDEAHTARQQAAAGIAYIAEHIDEADLRESFLNLAEVRRITG